MTDSFDTDPARSQPRPAAHDALGHLLDSLHQNGFLRVAHNFVDANSQIADVLGGLGQPAAQNGIQNLVVLLNALSRIPPGHLEKAAFAASDAVQHIAAWQPAAHHDTAPGVTGAYKLLHDEALWQAITPLLEGLKVFLDGLRRDAPASASGGAAAGTPAGR